MTERRVIAVSRAIGAGGEEIGRAVAAELRLTYADEDIIVKAAQAAGVSTETVARSEATPSLITRILDSMGRTAIVANPVAVAPIVFEQPAAYEALIERVIHEIAAQGDVLIVGHGASIPLAGTPGLLRVLVTASPDVRASRLATAEGMDAQRAAKAVKDSDRQRREYLRRFYDVDQELPAHYDIVVNTETLSFEAAARAIVDAARG